MRRDYRVTTRAAVITEGIPGEKEQARSERMASISIIGPVVHGGREYVLERVVHPPTQGGEPEATFERHLREDETGLYGSDWAESDPLSADERRYLAYPLTEGLRWEPMADSSTVLEAVRREIVTVPAGRFDAWRIDLRLQFEPGFGNSYDEWYGSAGLIRSIGHLETELGTVPRSRRIREITWELVATSE